MAAVGGGDGVAVGRLRFGLLESAARLPRIRSKQKQQSDATRQASNHWFQGLGLITPTAAGCYLGACHDHAVPLAAASAKMSRSEAIPPQPQFGFSSTESHKCRSGAARGPAEKRKRRGFEASLHPLRFRPWPAIKAADGAIPVYEGGRTGYLTSYTADKQQ